MSVSKFKKINPNIRAVSKLSDVRNWVGKPGKQQEKQQAENQSGKPGATPAVRSSV